MIIPGELAWQAVEKSFSGGLAAREDQVFPSCLHLQLTWQAVSQRAASPLDSEGLNMSARHLRSWQGARRANTWRI
jgi:hypothetical protein